MAAIPPALRYEEFGLIPPEEYPYEDHEGPWCRYCGARASSGWGRGPWGLRTLCQPHNLQKKSLHLDDWPEEPIHPINSEENSELKYLDYCRKVGAGQPESTRLVRALTSWSLAPLSKQTNTACACVVVRGGWGEAEPKIKMAVTRRDARQRPTPRENGDQPAAPSGAAAWLELLDAVKTDWRPQCERRGYGDWRCPQRCSTKDEKFCDKHRALLRVQRIKARKRTHDDMGGSRLSSADEDEASDLGDPSNLDDFDGPEDMMDHDETTLAFDASGGNADADTDGSNAEMFLATPEILARDCKPLRKSVPRGWSVPHGSGAWVGKNVKVPDGRVGVVQRMEHGYVRVKLESGQVTNQRRSMLQSAAPWPPPAQLCFVPALAPCCLERSKCHCHSLRRETSAADGNPGLTLRYRL